MIKTKWLMLSRLAGVVLSPVTPAEGAPVLSGLGAGLDVDGGAAAGSGVPGAFTLCVRVGVVAVSEELVGG